MSWIADVIGLALLAAAWVTISLTLRASLRHVDDGAPLTAAPLTPGRRSPSPTVDRRLLASR